MSIVSPGKSVVARTALASSLQSLRKARGLSVLLIGLMLVPHLVGCHSAGPPVDRYGTQQVTFLHPTVDLGPFRQLVEEMEAVAAGTAPPDRLQALFQAVENALTPAEIQFLKDFHDDHLATEAQALAWANSLVELPQELSDIVDKVRAATVNEFAGGGFPIPGPPRSVTYEYSLDPNGPHARPDDSCAVCTSAQPLVDTAHVLKDQEAIARCVEDITDIKEAGILGETALWGAALATCTLLLVGAGICIAVFTAAYAAACAAILVAYRGARARCRANFIIPHEHCPDGSIVGPDDPCPTGGGGGTV